MMDDSRPSPVDVLGFDDCKIYENDAESERIDRLSELPDSLILHILSLMAMSDVVKTTLLSKRWKDLWTTVPCLFFEEDLEKLENYTADPFVKFVNGALALWKGSKIQEFTIMSKLDDSFSGYLDHWLDFALGHEVEELHIDLELDFFTYDVSSYFPTQRLYSSSSMRKLSLIGCRMKIDGTVHWDKLTSLTIEGVRLKEDVMNQVLFGCPQLEVLNLRLWESKNHLNIHSHSLKKLEIEKCLDDHYYFVKDTTLTIWAPNVEMLEMSGVMYCKYVLKNVVSLTNVTLDFSRDNYDDDGEMLGFMSRKETLMQVFQSIQSVENLALSDWCIQALEEMRSDPRTLLSDAKLLKLCVYDDNIPKVMNMLKMFPNLTMLVLEDEDIWKLQDTLRSIVDPYVLTFDEENLVKSQKEFHESCLVHLKTVEINWCAGNSSMINTLIENLQKYASKIEKMVIRPTVFKSPLP